MQTRRCSAGRASFSSASRSSACNPRAAACDVDERGRRRAQRADTVRPSRPSRCPQRSGDGDGAIGGVVLARARTRLLHRARLHTTPANASGSIAAQQADCPGAARRVKGARIYWQRSRICTQLTPSIPPCPCCLRASSRITQNRLPRLCNPRPTWTADSLPLRTWPSELVSARRCSARTPPPSNPKPGKTLPRYARRCTSRSPCAGRVGEMGAASMLATSGAPVNNLRAAWSSLRY
jgi:hypothetical protein